MPSFVVRLDSQKHIDFALTSPYGGGRAGRVKRKRAKAAASGGDDDAAEEEEDEVRIFNFRQELWQSLIGTCI